MMRGICLTAYGYRNMQKQFKLPTVNKPAKEIRELRRLFSVYGQLNKQIKTAKNYLQSVFTDNGMDVLKSVCHLTGCQGADAGHGCPEKRLPSYFA